MGVGLMGLSFAPWLAIFAVPLLDLSLARSGAVVVILLAGGEGLFWAGAVLAGHSLLAGLWRRLPWRRRPRDPEI